MGFFDAATKAAKAVAHTAMLPVDIAVDAVTLGGLCTERDEPHTATRVKKIAKEASEALDDTYRD